MDIDLAAAAKRGAASGGRAGPAGVSSDGSELTPDEVEFGRAMDDFKRLYHRPFPTFSEVLAVLLSLGYRKPAMDARCPVMLPNQYGKEQCGRKAGHDGQCCYERGD